MSEKKNRFSGQSFQFLDINMMCFVEFLRIISVFTQGKRVVIKHFIAGVYTFSSDFVRFPSSSNLCKKIIIIRKFYVVYSG